MKQLHLMDGDELKKLRRELERWRRLGEIVSYLLLANICAALFELTRWMASHLW